MIENFPNHALPALFLYKSGLCKKQLFLMREIQRIDIWHARKWLAATVEYLLFQNHVLESVLPRSGESEGMCWGG